MDKDNKNIWQLFCEDGLEEIVAKLIGELVSRRNYNIPAPDISDPPVIDHHRLYRDVIKHLPKLSPDTRIRIKRMVYNYGQHGDPSEFEHTERGLQLGAD